MENKSITNSELVFSMRSMVDDFGRVFFRDNKVYRAILNDKIQFCKTLLDSDMFKELSEKGMIPQTTISSLKIEGYELVLEHEKLLEIHQHEWSFDMLKSASLMVFEFIKICNRYGYELKDAHNLNVCFRGTQPVYVDIGSIVLTEAEKSTEWIAYEEYLGAFIMPLLLWSKGYIYIVRKLLESNFHRMFTIPAQSFSSSGLIELIDKPQVRFDFFIKGKKVLTTKRRSSILSFAEKASRKIFRILTKRDTNILNYIKSSGYSTLSEYLPIQNLEDTVQVINSYNADSEWKGYHTKFYINGNKINYSERFTRIADIIQNTSDIKTVLDLAGNEGLFCKLLADRLSLDRIILTDYDENAVNTAFQRFRKLGNKNVHTALLNFMFTPDLQGTTLRFKSDLVLALAITHHLILTAKYSLSAIFERLHLYSNKYVMVEFMPLGLWAKGDLEYPILPAFYHVDWFRKEFEKYFSIIIEEKLEENRILFFGTKIKMEFNGQ